MSLRYLPHTEQEIEQMLRTIGVKSLEELFHTIPDSLRLKRPLELPPALKEVELRHHLRGLSRDNAHGEEWTSFLGAGAYAHYIPSVVSQLLLRGEFLTAYTPYQPEVSQGTLQAIFEYQTLAAEILGMEIANASNYDGSTAMAEAALMALRLKDRSKIIVCENVHPEYRQVLRTYLQNQPVKIVEIPFTESGELNRSFLKDSLDDQTACVIASVPNFFGLVEDLSDVAEMTHKKEALFVVASPEPLAFGLFLSPGEMGADIAVAEGQGFGGSLNFGGPSLGLFATKREYVRALPGRLVGETVDEGGERGFVLTLATREQHIRRERATSNICTNVSLCALAATITLALWGKDGFENLSRLNFQRTQDLKKRLLQKKGVELIFPGTHFNEFLLRPPVPVEGFLKKLTSEKILGGVSVERWYPSLKNSLLLCLTEITPDEQVDRFLHLWEGL